MEAWTGFLPPGKPDARGEEGLAKRLTDLTPEGGFYRVPQADAVELLRYYAEWRAWALALEKAGRWKRPGVDTAPAPR